MNLTNERLLVIAAHADDEAIGCGGVLMAHKGPKQVIIVTTPGQFRGTNKSMSENLIKASKLAGFNYCVLSFKDQGLDRVSQVTLNKQLESCIDEFKPDLVLTHSAADHNRDHVIVHEAVNVAARSIPNLLYFQIPSLGQKPGFNPSVYCPITVDDKADILECYDEEMRPFPHPRSYLSLNFAARSDSNCEAFEIGRLRI